jgi:hypothetical protein
VAKDGGVKNGKWKVGPEVNPTDCGLVKIAARTLGPLAVHFGIGSQSEKISISHVGTGRRIASTSSEEAAQQIAEALAELDWEMLQSDSLPPGLQIAVSSILKRYESEIDHPPKG